MIKKIFLLIAIILSLLAAASKADNVATLPRTIFISDVHMCDYSSIEPTSTKYKPYGWFNKNSKLLANFLTKIGSDNSGREIVILGDLFDGWVCPFDMDPLYGAEDVDDMFKKMGSTDNPINGPVVTALKTLASAGRLIYVPGNHDMLLTEKTLKEIIPGIDYRDKYESDDGIIVAEHGHNYCLFNAPDKFDDDPTSSHILPLGYFITRAASYKAAYSEELITTPEVIKLYSSTTKNTGEEASLTSIFSAIAYLAIITYLGADKWPKSPIAVMSNIDNFKSMNMLGDVLQRYAESSSKWPSKQKQVDATRAFWDDAGALSLAAYAVYINNVDDNHKIVIFGHTHQYGLEQDPESGKIYANSGTWVDRAKKCTYVETEKKSDNTYIVSLYEYTDKGSKFLSSLNTSTKPL